MGERLALYTLMIVIVGGISFALYIASKVFSMLEDMTMEDEMDDQLNKRK